MKVQGIIKLQKKTVPKVEEISGVLRSINFLYLLFPSVASICNLKLVKKDVSQGPSGKYVRLQKWLRRI